MRKQFPREPADWTIWLVRAALAMWVSFFVLRAAVKFLI